VKKILIFADSFLPGFKGGGPVTSMVNLVLLLNNNFNILICTRNCDFGDIKPYEDVKSDMATKYKEYNIVYLSNMDKNSISNVMDEFNPDLLYLNSFFSKTTQIVMFLNKFTFKKKMIVAPRGELQQNALNIKSTIKSIYLFMYKFLKLYKNIDFHSTDEIETKSIKELFGINSVTQLANAVKIQDFKRLSKKKNELKMIFISRISPKKNLLFALEILKDTKVDVSFDIYGPKEDIKYWDRCEKIINQLPSNIKVKYQGSLQPNEIIKTLRNYHTFFFPTLSENFGHIIVEAMQSGLVPIMSDQTPWLELEKQSVGYDINLDNKQKYLNTIEELYLSDDKEYAKKSLGIINYIHNKLDIDELTKNYITFFNRL
jgi:glycosyltransferase involved in cell wall biosynthesis